MAMLLSLVVNGFLLLQVLSVCTCDEASNGQPKTFKSDQEEADKEQGVRQIFAPRMGKDVPADETAEKLFVRIPPLPKLGKTFDAYLNQYRREEDATRENEIDEDEWKKYELQADETGNSNKRAVSMLRMGKRAGVSMLRMGKKSDDEYNRDQRAVSMLRMGRSNGDELSDEEKRAVSMLRMGRRSENDKRAVSMLRMGRSGDDKRAVSMLRMGRSGADEKRAVSMLRMG